MKKIYTHFKFTLFIVFILFKGAVHGQVSSTYTFSQTTTTYEPLVATYPSMPANIFDTAWDDDTYTGFTLPFNFYYNNTIYTAGTTLGLDTDAWLVFNPGTMTGQTGGGSWVSASQSDGVYLYGSANDNGFAGFNGDLHRQPFSSITGNLTSGSNTVTGISGAEFDNLQVGTRLISTNIPDGTVILAITGSGFTMSANASATINNNSIIPAASIFGMTRGTAPNRQFVIQWTQVKRYSGANNDRFSFQMILEETPPQALKVVYGNVSTDVTTNLLMQVGLRGNTSADFNSRTSSVSWAATTASTVNTNTLALKKTNVPAGGLTYIWTPVCITMATTGSISGASTICPENTFDYSVPAVAGATYYTWAYSGTGASFSATTPGPINNIAFASNVTAGTLSVTPANACGSSSTATKPITLSTSTQILSTAGSSRCGTGNLSLTATANPGNIIRWYATASGGAYISTGTPFNTASIASTTSYYVNAEEIAAGKTGIVGTGGTTPFSYEGVFDHLYGGCQTQFLVKASELLQAGLRTGNITRLGIRFVSVYAQSYSGFAISMMQTTNTDMNAGLNAGTFTSVYTAASVTPAAGINNYTLATAFNWDGSSNVIIKICWSNNNTGGTDNYVQVDATSYVSGAYYRADNQNPAAICGSTTGTGTLSYRPQFYFTGTGLICSSPRTEVIATVNPQPSAPVMNPTAASICTSDPAQALAFTGATYAAGIVNAYTQGFETFPAPNFTAGTGVTAATNTTYNAEGSKSVLLTYGASLTPTGNNAYALTSNVNLAASSSATLSFKHICALEGYFSTYDAGYVQYSSDAGGTWTTFPNTSYTGSGTLINNISGIGTVTGTVFSTLSYPSWTSQFAGSGTTPGAGPATALWKTETINVPAAALTANFRIRFLIVSDGSVSYYGWLIDDVKIAVPGTAAAPVVWTPSTGLYTNAGATTTYSGGAAATVYARPASNTTYTATATAPGGCTAVNTVAVTVKPSNTWLGINATWGNSVNWCPNVPTISTDVTINPGVPFMPVLSSGTGTVQNITITTGASLTVSNAVMQVAGTISAANSIDASSGTIELKGSAAQNITGSSFINRSIRNIIASNNVNVSAATNDSLKITGVLSFGASGKVFNAGDNVILASTATGTARVADITNNGTLSGNSFLGKFVVQRYIPARRAWRLMTAPISTGAQTINQAWQESVGGTWSANPKPGYGTHITGGSARPTAQGFDQGPLNASIYGHSGTAWNYLPSNTAEMVTDKQGWMLFVRGSRAINLPSSAPATVPDITILRPTGTINYGTQPTVTGTGFVVVGNPFPSPVNFKTINKSGVIGGVGGNAYYLWDPNLGGANGVGAFVTFSFNSGGTYDKSIVTGTGTSNITNTGVIPSSAAFMVNLNPGGTITIAEKDKDTVVTAQPYLFRPVAEQSSLRASLYEIDTDGSKGIADGNLITFSEASNTAIENEDAIKINNFWENFSIVRDGIKIAIERRNLLFIRDTIFYSMWNMKQKSYELEIAMTALNIPFGAMAFLEDTYLQQRTALGYTDTTRVGFTVTANAGSRAPNRFMIVIEPVSVVPVTFTTVRAYEIDHDIMVEWSVQNEMNITNYDVEKSLDGIKFISKNITNAIGGNVTYKWLDKYPATGDNYYRVKCRDVEGRINYSRIVKITISNPPPAISIYPNPVTDGIININFSNASAGIYSIKLYNSAGQSVFSGQITHAGGNASQAVNLDKRIAKGSYQLELMNGNANRQLFKIIIE